MVGIGGGNDRKGRGADVLAHEELTLEGLIAENTRLQLTQGFVHPSPGNGIESSALSALPGITGRSFFHLGIFNPYDFAGGAHAVQRPVGALAVGLRADVVLLDETPRI